ncbi:cytoskeleton-associated protein 5-like [Crassostrea virginica]
MGDDTEWMKLPTDEKVQHKVWKARLAGYEEASKLFCSITDEKSPEFNKYAGLMKKFVTDTNAFAQEKGLDAVMAFIENANVAGRVCQDVIQGVINKCFNSSKQKTKEKGMEVIMLYIEAEKQDVVQECLLAGLDNKQPKIVITTVQTLRMALRDFGNKIMPIKPLVPKLPKLLEDRDKQVREEAKQLIIEIYRWIKQAIKPQMSNFNAIQVAELEAEFEKVANEKPHQQRFLRSQQDLKAKMEEQAAAGGGGEEEGEDEAEDEVDAYELLTAVDILALLPKDFYDKIEAKKWQERKEALEALEKLTNNPKIEGGDFGQLVRALQKVIAKDTNVMLVALGGKCLAGLANGLRKKFAPYAVSTVQCVLEKFKEKKQMVVLALRECIDAAFPCISLESVQEDIVAALDNKNPSIKAEAASFLARCFAKSSMSTLPKKLLKAFCASLMKTVLDTSPEVREASFLALGTAMKVVSEKHIMPFLVDVDNIKMQKIKECCDTAVLLNMKGEPRSGQPAKKPADNQPKPVQRPATAAPPAAKAASSRPSTAPSGGSKSGGPPKKAGAKGKGAKKSAGGAGKEEVTESLLSDEAVDEKAEALFTADVLKQIASANWKERLEGIQKMFDIVKGKSKEELKTQVVVRTVAKKPGLKDNNFQVLKVKVDLLAHLGKNTVFTKVSAGFVLSDLVDKIGDVKNGSSVQEALSCIAESCSLEFVGKEVLSMGFEQKNPKNQSESLNWLTSAIKDFGLKVNVKLLIENIKKSFAHTNPAVRSAGISLCGVIYMYMGQNFRVMFDNEKPALLKELDAEIEKVKGEKPPAPTRGLTGGGGDADDDEDEVDADDKDDDKIDDSLPRTDISEKITQELVNEMADKNWKLRKEALEKVEAILKEAPFVAPNLGPLPEALKLRLNDNNKILIGSTLGICSTLGTKLGPHCKAHIRIIGPALISCFGDSKPNLRASAVAAFNVWMESCNLVPLVEQEALSDALKQENPNLRQELLGWLSEKLPSHKQLPSEFKLCIPHLLSCLEDRNGDVRKKAQDAVVPFMIHTGYESVFRACSKLKPASKDQITAIIEKAKANLPAKPTKTKKSASAKAAAAPVSMDDMDEEPKAAPSRPLSTASSEGGAETKTETKTRTVRGKAKAAPAPSKKKKTEEDTSPPMNLTVPKERRFKDEKSLKILKWNFIQLTPEYVEQLTLQMEKNFSKGMMDMMYNVDFKQHTKAIEILIKSLDTLRDETVGNLDLILKWFTVRFLDTNPSMLNKALEYLRLVLTMLVDMDYSLHEYEATSFIPYLIIKVGDAKDNVRKDVRGIIKILYKLYPVSKMFTFLMDGIKSKNAKQRMECIEELGNLIEAYGISVCQPSPSVAVKNIAGQIGDRDNGVRNAALNAAVQAYMDVGSENQFYKMTGNLNDKDQSLLDERIKRSLKNKPPPKAKEEERPKTAAPAQPQRSASQSQIQRPATALPKSASSSSMKKTHLTTFEFEKTEMEMPKLNQFDLDELFKPVEMPKISRARDPSPMTRVNPADASATIGVVIAQITSTDILTCIQALAQIDELLKDDERARLLGGHMDQLMLHISMQFRMTLSTHMNNEEVPREEVVRLYRCLLATLLALTQNSFLATKTSKDILKDLFNSLIKILLDQRLSLLHDGPQVVRSVNVMIVKIMEKSDYTNCLCALIKSLQECVGSETCSPKFLELIMKCIWKMIKMVPEIINDLAVDKILLETHLFLRNFPTSTWKNRSSDLPLRTIKTVIHTLAMLKGAKILSHLNLIDASENSEVKMFLQKSLKKDPNARNEMNGSSDDTDSIKSHQKAKKLNKSTHDMLAEIFKKIGSKENTIEGLNNLYDFKKKHPEADLDPFLKMSSQYFQNYIERGLKNIEREREGRAPQSEPTGYGMTERSTKPALTTTSAEELDANFYMNKLRTIRANCGLENTDPSKQENTSKKDDKPEKKEKIAIEERDSADEICIKPVLSSSENRDNNQTASSGNPASSTDVSELKMRLERIKRLAKS